MFRGRITGFVKQFNGSHAGFGEPVVFGGPEADNVVTSRHTVASAMHLPVIDLDLPARLEPSSTPGHFHLYLDHPMTFENYIKLLTVMVEVGLVEQGYLDATQHRGYGTLRLPGVLKDAEGLTNYIERLLA